MVFPFFSNLIKKSDSLPNFLIATSPKFIFANELLNEDTLICLSVTRNSIKVPPLKSTPKFNPLKINKHSDIAIKIPENKLKNL